MASCGGAAVDTLTQRGQPNWSIFHVFYFVGSVPFRLECVPRRTTQEGDPFVDQAWQRAGVVVVLRFFPGAV